MRPKGPRIPFDHVKEIYGDKLEKYSYDTHEEVDPELRKRIVQEKIHSKAGYETIRGKILDFVILIFIFLMLGAGVYFIFTSIIAA